MCVARINVRDTNIAGHEGAVPKAVTIEDAPSQGAVHAEDPPGSAGPLRSPPVSAKVSGE